MRGGKRQGAGRPTKKGKRNTLTVRISLESFGRLNSICKRLDWSQSDCIDYMLKIMVVPNFGTTKH